MARNVGAPADPLGAAKNQFAVLLVLFQPGRHRDGEFAIKSPEQFLLQIEPELFSQFARTFRRELEQIRKGGRIRCSGKAQRRIVGLSRAEDCLARRPVG